MIGVIACSNTKAKARCPAREMYQGALFKKSVAYIERLRIPWFIISAKYGLMKPDQIILPYELKIQDMSEAEKDHLGRKVNEELKKYLKKDEVVLALAGFDYMIFARDIPVLMPMIGLRIGKRLGWLEKKLAIPLAVQS